MLNKRIQVLFDPDEYRRLREVAKKEKKSVGAVIREALEKRLSPKKRSRFDRLAAFGIWSKVKRTDSEILQELGGNWRNFPLPVGARAATPRERSSDAPTPRARPGSARGSL